MLHYKLDTDGQPVACDLLEWATWFEGAGASRIVAQDMVGDVQVSTVFLALDHDWSGAGPPVLWETMIFGGRHSDYQRRYSSREAAVAGHVEALALASVTRNIELED